jgi:hypothetical protein
MGWLPTTITSGSSAICDADRNRCSSSSRVTNLWLIALGMPSAPGIAPSQLAAQQRASFAAARRSAVIEK